jgi:hypothetical protein
VLAGFLFYFKVGWLLPGDSTVEDPKEMGYCFDVALDPVRGRLYIAAGQRGLHILDISDGKLNYISTFFDEGYYRNIKIVGDRVFVANSKRGLEVLDITGEEPIQTWAQSNEVAAGLHIEDDKAYVAAYEDGLHIFDISNPDMPGLISSLDTPGSAWDVWVHDGFAYIADFHAGMTVIDVSTATEPRYIGTTTWIDKYQTAEIIRGEGNTAYIAAGSRGLIILDVSDPLNPVIATIYHPKRIFYAEGLAVRDGNLYLAVGSEFLNISTIENGLHVFDVKDPFSPKLLGKAPFLDLPEGVIVNDSLVYVANTWTGARSIVVKDPTNPIPVDLFNTFK